MSGSEPIYSARVRIPINIERARAQVVKLEIYRDGALVAPSSGTYTLTNPSGDTASTGAVTVSGSIAQHTIAAVDIPASVELGEGWLEEWALTIASTVQTFRRPASMVKRTLFPVIADVDLTAVYSDLADVRPSGLSSYQTYIDEAWFEIVGRIRGKGDFEYLIMDPQVLRGPHRDLTLYLIFRDFHSTIGEGRYLELAQEHREVFEARFRDITYRYDFDHDGELEDANTRRSLQPVIYTSQAPFHWRRR
tara:strand:- start:17400 stop:18149 length:750 start_codon:yes stop_codon:yes gene_type:complete